MMCTSKSAPVASWSFCKVRKRSHAHEVSLADRILEQLKYLLLDAAIDDLGALTDMRNRLDAKCLELEDQQKSLPLTQIWPVALVDDGEQAAADVRSLAG